MPEFKIFISLPGFYAGWMACVLGAADGNPLMGPVVAAVIVILGWRMQNKIAPYPNMVSCL